MPLDSLTPVHQSPNIENDPVDVDVIEPQLSQPG